MRAVASAEFSPQSCARIGGILWLASMLFPPVLVPAFIGELSFAVWLTVKGVNVAKWQEMAERSRR
jgi:nitrate reductase NapE component